MNGINSIGGDPTLNPPDIIGELRNALYIKFLLAGNPSGGLHVELLEADGSTMNVTARRNHGVEVDSAGEQTPYTTYTLEFETSKDENTVTVDEPQRRMTITVLHWDRKENALGPTDMLIVEFQNPTEADKSEFPQAIQEIPMREFSLSASNNGQLKVDFNEKGLPDSFRQTFINGVKDAAERIFKDVPVGQVFCAGYCDDRESSYARRLVIRAAKSKMLQEMGIPTLPDINTIDTTAAPDFGTQLMNAIIAIAKKYITASLNTLE